MYGYFSNNRFCPNYNVAKCIQHENTVRKEIMKYEIKPLKNSEAAKGIVENVINPKIEKVNKLHSYNKRRINPWVFFINLSVFHLLRIRKLKMNLSDMAHPLKHLAVCTFGGLFATYFLTIITGANFRSRLEIFTASRILKNMRDKMNTIYIKKSELQNN